MFIMERQRKFSLRKLAGYGLVSCAVGFVLFGGNLSIRAQEDIPALPNPALIDGTESNTENLSDVAENAEIISNEDETNMNLSDEKTNVSEAYSDTDELKATVTRTIYFKEKETNQDVAPPITQTIEVKQSSTGNFYYFNHENKENTNNSMLPEVIVPQMKGYTPDREVVQAVDVSKHVYHILYLDTSHKVTGFSSRILNTQAVVYYTKVTSTQEQPSLDLEYTEDELKAKAQLTGRVDLNVYKYEPNGEVINEILTYSDFMYDKRLLKDIIWKDYCLPMYRYNKTSTYIPTVEIDEPMKISDSFMVFHKDYVPDIQTDFIYTLSQYYLDENGEKVPIFETPSTITYHLDVNGLSVEDHLQALTKTGKVEMTTGFISKTKGGNPIDTSEVKFRVSHHKIIPKVFEHEGNVYVPMSNSISLPNLDSNSGEGRMTRQATASTDVVYYKIPRSESLDVLSNSSEDVFKIVINEFTTPYHITRIPVSSHYSWDKENGLQVTYELKDVDVAHFSDEKVQFEEISLVDLNEEPNDYDKYTAKPTQAVKVRYKLFLDGDKYIQREKINQISYKTANDSVFEIHTGRIVLGEDSYIQEALTHPNESVTRNSMRVTDILIKYDKDKKHLTEVPTAVRVTFTQPKHYRLNGNVLEETLGEITPVGDIQQIGLQLEELRILDIGKVSKTDTAINLQVLDSYTGIDKEKILGSLNERIQPLFKQHNQVRVFLLIAKDRIHASNPAYINEFNSDYVIYPIIIPGNEIIYSTIKTFPTTINYHIPDANAEVDSEEQLEQVALPDDFNFDTVVDEPTQTEKTEVKGIGEQADTPDCKDDGTQMDNPNTSDGGTQNDKPDTKDDGTQTEPGESSSNLDPVVPIDEEPIKQVEKKLDNSRLNEKKQSEKTSIYSNVPKHLPKMGNAELPKSGTKTQFTGILGLFMIGISSLGVFIRNTWRKE